MALQAVAEVFPPAGCDLRPPNHHPPTPALSFGVKHFGAAGAVMITSSHNPFNWNGVKYKASYGGSGRPAIMQAIEAELDKPVPQGSKTGTITDTDFKEPYIAAIKKFADLDKITRSEEHTSELQSPCNLVCRLLLEKKKSTKLPILYLFASFGAHDARTCLPSRSRLAVRAQRVAHVRSAYDIVSTPDADLLSSVRV